MENIAVAFPLQYGKTPLPPVVKQVRMQCALDFMTGLIAKDVKVIGLVDGFSLEFFQGSGADLFLDDGSLPTYGAAKRFTLRKAVELYGTTIEGVLVTEPEKTSLADCLCEISAPVISGKADIVVVGRTDLEQSLLTYPWHQRPWEEYGNAVCQAVMGRDMAYDYFLAPRFLGRNAWPSYLAFPGTSPKTVVPDIYDVNFAQLYLAQKLGLRICEVRVPFSYPPDQKQAEEDGPNMLGMVERRLKSLPLLVGSMIEYKKWLDLQPDPAATLTT